MTVPLLEISGLSVRYRRRGGEIVTALEAASLSLGQGEVLALVGESGSGKSTTAQAVAGLLDPAAEITGGSIRFAGHELVGLSERRFRPLRGRRIGFVPQDPTVSLNPVMRIGQQIADVARINGLADRRGALALAVEMLERVGISQPLLRARQYPHELSGGMRQRVLIGMAMLCRPALLIADEPTSALDVTVQRRVLDLIGAMAKDSGTSVLLITHDLGVAAERADRIVVMERGQVVETGGSGQILAAPRQPYTTKLVAAAVALSGRAAPRPAAAAATGAAPLVRVTGLLRRFPGGSGTVLAAENISFDIRPGETFALVGESGSGKTTTSRIIAGVETADAGSVTVDGLAPGADLRAYRRNVQMVYQNPYASLNPRMTVGQILAEPLLASRPGDRHGRTRAITVHLDAVGLPEAYRHRFPRELSGGQRQRVAIARALILRPKLMVLDEPVSALDVSVQAQILDLLAEIQREAGLTYLFVSHDLAVVRAVSDRVAVMQSGRIVESGPTADLFANPRSAYTRELIAAIPGRAAPV